MGWLVAERLPPTYESQTTLLVGPVSAGRDTLEAAGSQARHYAGVAETAVIVDRAAADLGLTPSAVRRKVEVTSSDVTRLVDIRARDGNADRAAALANAIAQALVAYSRPPGIAASPEGQLDVLERAAPSATPFGPSPELIIAVAALAGLAAALGLAALVDSLNTAIRNEEDLAAAAPMAFLGSVDGARLSTFGREAAVDSDPDSDTAAGYRLLAAKIELSNGGRPLRSIVLLDAQGGQSSISLAENLAGALAEGGARVSVIDNAQRGGSAKLFSRKPRTAERSEPDGALEAGRIVLDRIEPQGSRMTIVRPRDTSQPLELKQVREVLQRVLDDADVVLLTVPPMDRSPNSLVWSRAADATILVTERDHTKREQVPAALESLRLAGANVIGTVLCRDRVL
jgi:succinoglycan biosynthesis transport protein ExoP